MDDPGRSEDPAAATELPELSRSDDAQKIALAATIDFAGAYRIRVVDVHLQSGLTPVQLGDQAQVIARCVFEERCPAGATPVAVETWADEKSDGTPGNVVLAGDFNTGGEAQRQVLEALLAPRQDVRLGTPTFWLLGLLAPGRGRLDHVFYGAGLTPGEPHVGTIKISDHRPVMVEFSVVRQKR